MTHRPEVMFSETLEELRNCYQEMNFPHFTGCTPVEADFEALQRLELIELCVRIAREFGHELGEPGLMPTSR